MLLPLALGVATPENRVPVSPNLLYLPSNNHPGVTWQAMDS